VFPAGKVGLLIGAGGVSKTMALIDLALSVATGRPWLSAYEVPEPGPVAILLGEEDFEEVHRRFWLVSRSMGLSAGELRRAESTILVAPLAGHSTGLIGPYGASELADEYMARLEAERVEWRLIVLDPLSRFAGLDAETSNSMATTYISVLERFTALVGRPSVCCSHHTNQVSREGKIANATAARGVTALTDGARWVAAMVEDEAADTVALRVIKSNYGPKFPQLSELLLKRREQGVVSAVSEREAWDLVAEREARARDKRDGNRVEAIRLLLLEAERNPHHKSKNSLVNSSGAGRTAGLRALSQLEEEGLLVLNSQGCYIPKPVNGGAQ
jgi:RecA-family ATPase